MGVVGVQVRVRSSMSAAPTSGASRSFVRMLTGGDVASKSRRHRSSICQLTGPHLHGRSLAAVCTRLRSIRHTSYIRKPLQRSVKTGREPCKGGLECAQETLSRHSTCHVIRKSRDSPMKRASMQHEM